MSKHIYLRVSLNESVDPDRIIKSLGHSYAILQELDSSVSGETNGAVDWGIDKIKKESPLTVAFSAERLRLNATDPWSRLQAALFGGLRVLARESEAPVRPEMFSDKALKAAKGLADLLRHKDVREINLGSDGDQIQITHYVARAVRYLIESAEESEGSIIGNLDSITVHKSHEFRVWDDLTGRAVTCAFHRDLLESVKDALRSRVLVYGKIRRNADGIPVSIAVEGLKVEPADADLPSIREMSGFFDDLTGGATLTEYIEDLRGD